MFCFVCFFQGLAIAAVRFRFDGQPISEVDTPASLEMEEGDTIEVYQQQLGGCWFSFKTTLFLLFYNLIQMFNFCISHSVSTADFILSS